MHAAKISAIQKKPNILYFFRKKFFHFDFSSYLCTIAWLAQSWAAGGLIYEKDVFGRLSLCITNFANSQSHSRQMTTRRLRGAYLYTFNIYSSFWRGLTALSILCGKGNAKACYARMGRRTAPTPFLYTKEN